MVLCVKTNSTSELPVLLTALPVRTGYGGHGTLSKLKQHHAGFPETGNMLPARSQYPGKFL
jgi:hypothetical protein